MENTPNGYHTSFFRPTTGQARANRDMIIVLVCIWTLTIFGFQVLLKVLGKPTPEEAFYRYERVWDQVVSGDATKDEHREFAFVCLSVLGKNFILPEYRVALDNGLSYAAFKLADSSEHALLLDKLLAFERIKSEAEDITDPEYVLQRDDLAGFAAGILGLARDDVRTRVLPVELSSRGREDLSDQNEGLIPEAMKLYLIHNQSFLTQTRFLGFPFHYFYTAIFLLVLFVGLCWLYCVQTDRIRLSHGVAD